MCTGCPGPAGKEQCGAVLFEMHNIHYQGMFIYMCLLYTYILLLCYIYDIYLYSYHRTLSRAYPILPLIPYIPRRIPYSLLYVPIYFPIPIQEMFRKYSFLLEKSLSDPSILVKAMSAVYMSDLDPCSALIYGHNSEEEYYSSISTINYDHVDIPMLLVQPLDDPLHSNDLAHTININSYLTNNNIIYYQPEFGNHFGFYEGPLYQAFSNESCYQYPPRLAAEFFNTILTHNNNNMNNSISNRPKHEK